MLNPLTHRRVLKKGVPGRATIVAASVPERGASMFNMALTLQVFVEGRVPYEVEDQWMVKAGDPELRAKLEAVLGYKLTPGSTISVGENDPALQMRIMQVIAEHHASRIAAPAPSPVPSGPSGGTDDELVARLERLTALHDAGALSDEEFAEAKRRMLDDG